MPKVVLERDVEMDLIRRSIRVEDAANDRDRSTLTVSE